jgi:ABC-type proline/glycine betaine transport system permease subunit
MGYIFQRISKFVLEFCILISDKRHDPRGYFACHHWNCIAHLYHYFIFGSVWSSLCDLPQRICKTNHFSPMSSGLQSGTLAGIPSIIYGLFGLALFVQALNFGTSILSAGLTLGLLSLPYIITTTEEALKRIPNSLREAALALGVTQFETIKDVVLPKAFREY